MVAPVIRGPRTILVLLTALNLLNYLDRFVLSAVLPGVSEDLHLSGSLTGSLATVFLIGYFGTSPIFGAWADRVGPGGRQKLMALGVVVWSLATIASGLARDAWSLVAARAIVGVGEASFVTIGTTFVDDVAPRAKKGRWQAVFSSAIPIGSALGYIVGCTVEKATHSWRSAFLVAGLPGIVLALGLPRARRAGAGGARWTRRTRSAQARHVGSRALAPSPLSNDGPRLLRLRVRHWGLCVLGPHVPASALRPTDRGRGSFLRPGDRGGRSHRNAPRGLVGRQGSSRGCEDDESIARAALRVCTLSAGLGAPLAALAILAPSATGFYGALLPCEIAALLQGGPFNVAVLRSAPPGLRASAMAVSIFASHLLGDLWSPPLIGLVKDHAPFSLAILIAPVGFAAAAIMWWRAPLRLTKAVAVR